MLFIPDNYVCEWRVATSLVASDFIHSFDKFEHVSEHLCCTIVAVKCIVTLS